MPTSAPNNSNFSFLIDQHQNGQRLDQFLAVFLTDLTRSQVARLIDLGHVHVNGELKKRSYRLHLGDVVSGENQPREPESSFNPEPIALNTLFEDKHICVINKPPGMVVHPAPGNYSGTLVNALLYRFEKLQADRGNGLRPGIVHRLDKDTSGVMVVAKHNQALERLAQAFKSRQVDKSYLALVRGSMKQPYGLMDDPIGRHPVHRKRMAVNVPRSRSAITEWRCLKTFAPHASLLQVTIKTGRTHQIRVHCAAMDHPVIGDATYGGRHQGQPHLIRLPAPRQLLHAWKIGFAHPLEGNRLRFRAPLPSDMRAALHTLNHANKKG